jgi:hypothetical protein
MPPPPPAAWRDAKVFDLAEVDLAQPAVNRRPSDYAEALLLGAQHPTPRSRPLGARQGTWRPIERGRRYGGKTHGERQIYTNKWVKLCLVDVPQPDARRWEYHVVRLRHLGIAALANDRQEVLMMWRHRFILGGTQRWSTPARPTRT